MRRCSASARALRIGTASFRSLKHSRRCFFNIRFRSNPNYHALRKEPMRHFLPFVREPTKNLFNPKAEVASVPCKGQTCRQSFFHGRDAYMTPSRLILGTVLLLSTALSAWAQQVDSVYTNGRIYTVDQDNPWAEAIAVSEGRLLVVGSNKDVEALIGDTTEVIDLNGAFMMPGIQENHVHASSAGATILKYANRATFPPESTPDEIRQALLVYAEANPGDGWIWGQQWDPFALCRRASPKGFARRHIPRPTSLSGGFFGTQCCCEFQGTRDCWHHEGHAPTRDRRHRNGPCNRRAVGISRRDGTFPRRQPAETS